MSDSENILKLGADNGKKKARVHDDMVELVTNLDNEISFGCFLCDKSFKKRWDLTRHQKQSHQPLVKCRIQKIEGGFVCKICHEFQENRNKLSSHLWNEHLEERVQETYGQEYKVLVP
jgi:uncharacterized C2H2 Zn-finger protein